MLIPAATLWFKFAGLPFPKLEGSSKARDIVCTIKQALKVHKAKTKIL